MTGPINSTVSAAILPNKFAGILFSPERILRTIFPMLAFDGNVLNAFLIWASVDPAGQVIEAILAPAGTPQVQGASNAALKQGFV